MTADGRIEFIGPLDRQGQSWCDETFKADCASALVESPDLIIRRREAAIASYHRTVITLLLSGDTGTARTIAFGAVAESRALAAFRSACPADCVDCFVYDRPCAVHATGLQQAVDSDWHRFGS